MGRQMQMTQAQTQLTNIIQVQHKRDIEDLPTKLSNRDKDIEDSEKPMIRDKDIEDLRKQ